MRKTIREGGDVICEGGVALWLGRWIFNTEVLGSNPLPCHQMDLYLVVPDSTPSCCINSQLVRHLPVGIFTRFLFHLQYSFAYFSVPK